MKKYLEVAFNRLDYPDVAHVEAGMVNVEGFKLAMPDNYWERFWGPVFEDISIQTTVNNNEPDAINKALLKIFTSVFDAAGTERPENLGGFPQVS